MSVAVLESHPENLEEVTESPIVRFLAISEARMARVHQSLSRRKQAFLAALPLMFHSNEQDLPGFVTNMTPFGIADYSPSDETLVEARRFAKNNTVGRKAPQKFDILGLYFMGSAGTIAYNGDSDFDIWIFTDPSVQDEALRELQEKASLIEAWAARSEIEVHFFIINPDEFRAGEMLPISSESSGSSQEGLLLDEFYRSSIKIAGLPLTWWLVPIQYEMEYENYLESQKNVSIPDQPPIDKCIDLGPLTEIAPEEFFGAAIWQLSKSIKTPYKSVMKLLLMEVYAADESGISLISHQFKKQVYKGISDINLLDPWKLMFRQIEEYLIDNDDGLRLNILRRSFYLKVNEKLTASRNNKSGNHWRYDVIRSLVDKWRWDEEKVSELDSRESWKLETVTRERSNIVNALTKSFRSLSQFANQQTDNTKITQSDLALLNRMLFAAFERKSGKIEIVNRGISPDIREETVSLHLLRPSSDPTWELSEFKPKPDSWVLYRGIVSQRDLGDSTHLKRTSSLMEMLAWSYFNKILDKDCKIMLYLPADVSITSQEIITLLEALGKEFPLNTPLDDKDIETPVRIVSGAVFVNTGFAPRTDSSLANTMISSQRTNALSFGGRHENLTKTFDLILTTSWGETFIKHYSGTEALIDCISEYMSWSPMSQNTLTEALKVYCYSPSYGSQIRKTLNTIFNDIVELFFANKGVTKGRYILEVEDGFQSIELNEDVISSTRLENHAGLLQYLGKPQASFSKVHFGPNSCSDTVLPTIYSENKPDAVQLFFYLKNNQAKIYVLDEKGSLFTHINSFYSKHTFLGHYKIFADAILERILHGDLSNLLHETECVSKLYSIENYQKVDGTQAFEIEPVNPIVDRTTNYLSLQVLCDRDENHTEQYTIYCKDKEFSSLEYGENLFDQVAKQIMMYRGSRQTYPVHITDIDLSQTMLNDQSRNQFQSNQFFRYKQHIESKLTKALEKM